MSHKIHLLIGFLLLVSLLKSNHLSARTMDAENNSDVILVYKDNGQIVIRQCENNTVIELRSDCKVKPGTIVRNVSISDFKSSLKMALKLPVGNYNNFEEPLRIQNDNAAELKIRYREIKDKVAGIEAFIDEYRYGNAASIHLDILRENLSKLESALRKNAKLGSVTKDVNEYIDHLVDEIILSDTFYKFTFSKNKTGFVFNILSSFLRTPMISTSFQRIEKGKFTMGSPSGEEKRDDDEGHRELTISRPFDIMTTEVTQMQWFLVMGTNPSLFNSSRYCDDYININGEGICPSNPVEQVSWSDVQIFIKKLNDSLGLSGCKGAPSDPKGCYRLPTEAEWEYAARGGTTSAYSFGNDTSSLADYAWYKDNTDNKTHPVGLKMANPYGLYDMHGNVWEWVQDKQNKRLNFRSNSIIRGGGWVDQSPSLRSAVRVGLSYGFRVAYIGFRLARTL